MQTIPTTEEDASGPAKRRRTRYRQRGAAQRFGSWVVLNDHAGDWGQLTWRRTAGCGRSVISDSGLVGLRRREGDDGPSCYFDGILRCGSVWLCPVCTATIRARRSVEVALAAARHAESGGVLGMLSLTIRHDRALPLAKGIDGLQGAWGSVRQSAMWRLFRQSMVGYIVTKEVTLGENGWHPHLHLLILWEPGCEYLGDALREWLQDRGAWAERVERRTASRPNHHGVDYRVLDAGAAAYVTKIAQEQVRSDHKTNDVLPVLLDGVGDGDAVACARWSEWCEVMHGRRMMVWSQGLRAQLLGDVEELSDEEVVNADVGGQLLGTMDRRRYLSLIATTSSAPTPAALLVLEEAERGRLPAWLDPPGDAEEPPPELARALLVACARRR